MPEQPSDSSPLEVLLPRDLAVASKRLILTRWAAGVLVIFATAASTRLLHVPLPALPLYLTGLAILGYNALLMLLGRHVASTDAAIYLRRTRQLVVLQVALDWVCMAVFLHFTGGITSPGIVFLLIHMLMVTILLPGWSSYAYVALGVIGIAVLAALEGLGTIPHHNVIPALPTYLYRDPIYIAAQVLFFGIAAFAMVTLATTIMTRLRERERQISALFRTTQAVSSTLSLTDVLDHLARNAAQALSTTHSSIRLLDETGESLRLAASYGLSEAYQAKGSVLLSHNPLAKEALSGRPAIVQDAGNDERLQYPRQVLDEGIRSLVVVPIIGRSGPLGILRVYSDQVSRFNDADAEFVMTIARQGAVAIENAMAHERLQQADTDRAQFVRTVTHELRAPVGGAQSLLRVLLKQIGEGLNETQRDIISRVEARLDSLMELIEDLLALAASKTAGYQEAPEAISLQSEVDRAVDAYAAEAQEKGIDLRCNAPPPSITVRATRDGLAQILGNLIGNAVKYTSSGGKVRVSAEVRGASAVVIVSDTGMGIPADELPHLWQEFFRASNARKSGTVGTGLGLSIVKRLVESYGGLISVQSREGEGTSFTVTLPLAGP